MKNRTRAKVLAANERKRERNAAIAPGYVHYVETAVANMQRTNTTVPLMSFNEYVHYNDTGGEVPPDWDQRWQRARQCDQSRAMVLTEPVVNCCGKPKDQCTCKHHDEEDEDMDNAPVN